MGLRTVQYGYKVENGVYIFDPHESNVVKEIFNYYINGMTLLEISNMLTEKQEVYYEEQKNWNKNMICRIIASRRYIGDKNYPPMIPLELWETANSRRASSGGKKTVLPPEIEYLREITKCHCGARYKRINTWKTREKWLCVDGCKCSNYIDDKAIFDAISQIVNFVSHNPEALRNININSTFAPNNDVVRQINEVNRVIESQTIDFSHIADLLLECTAKKFECCHLSRSEEVTDVLIDEISGHDSTDILKNDNLRKYIIGITILPDGKLEIEFYNHKIISSF